MMEIEIKGERLVLLSEKAAYWPKHARLFLSDVHLGKTQHFRKNGLALSSGAEEQDIQSIKQLVDRLAPKEVYILGDLFHSDLNSEWPLFQAFISEYPETQFLLVPGNHDVLDHSVYKNSNLQVCASQHFCEPFTLIHELPENPEKEAFYFYGHIHPGVVLKGKGRQIMRLPAFYLGKNYLLLPAFGRLTGLHVPKVSKSVTVYAASTESVFEVPLAGRG
ncbi:MAG: ligase-associated DNA damage response endonuclease PdeM [Bacteroidetes bacterium]|nr:MAG: ligase-associated DNA damage response endonuclease PdeM [Bacteroidota bacterium]